MATFLSSRSKTEETKVDSGRIICYRNKPEVEALIKRVLVAKGGSIVPMTGHEWDLWTEYVRVI